MGGPSDIFQLLKITISFFFVSQETISGIDRLTILKFESIVASGMIQIFLVDTLSRKQTRIKSFGKLTPYCLDERIRST